MNSLLKFGKALSIAVLLVGVDGNASLAEKQKPRGPSAPAQSKSSNEPKLKAVTMFNGDCRLNVYGIMLDCGSRVIFAEYVNGRSQVWFNKSGDAWILAGGGERQPDLENYY